MSAIVLTTLSLEYVAPTNFLKTIILCHDIIFLNVSQLVSTYFQTPIFFTRRYTYQSLTNDLVKNCQVEKRIEKINQC